MIKIAQQRLSEQLAFTVRVVLYCAAELAHLETESGVTEELHDHLR